MPSLQGGMMNILLTFTWGCVDIICEYVTLNSKSLLPIKGYGVGVEK